VHISLRSTVQENFVVCPIVSGSVKGLKLMSSLYKIQV